MATKLQWEVKIKTWLPSWFYQGKPIETAVIKAYAAVFEQLELDLADQIAQTMVDHATGGYLSLHGDERSVFKEDNESDDSYRERIKKKSTKPQVSPPSLLQIVNSILAAVGPEFATARMVEDFEGSLFCDREYTFDRGDIIIDPVEPAFSIIIDSLQEDNILNSIIKALYDNKAFGVGFRLVELYDFAAQPILDQDGEYILDQDGEPILEG